MNSSTKLVVGRSRQAVLAHAQVEAVLEEGFVIGSRVQKDRQCLFRGNAAAGGVEREFAHGDAHAAGPEVAQAQDALAIGHDDDAHVAVRPVRQDVADHALFVAADEEAARTLENMRVVLAARADGRRVDDGHELLYVVDDDAVEQVFVAVEQGHHLDELLESRGAIAHVAYYPKFLLLHARYPGRQEAHEPQVQSFLAGEGRSFIEQRVPQKVYSSFRRSGVPSGVSAVGRSVFGRRHTSS